MLPYKWNLNIKGGMYHRVYVKKTRTFVHLHQHFEKLLPQSSKLRDYRYFHTKMHVQELHMLFCDTILSQYSMKTGIKEFGQEGVEAVKKELQQLHDMETMDLMSPETMTRE